MAFVCETCGKSFLTSEKLRFHRAVHGVENIMCHICDKICIGKKAFNNHIKTHQTYECSICKETIKMNSISYHNKKCASKKEKSLYRRGLLSMQNRKKPPCLKIAHQTSAGAGAGA